MRPSLAIAVLLAAALAGGSVSADPPKASRKATAMRNYSAGSIHLYPTVPIKKLQVMANNRSLPRATRAKAIYALFSRIKPPAASPAVHRVFAQPSWLAEADLCRLDTLVGKSVLRPDRDQCLFELVLFPGEVWQKDHTAALEDRTWHISLLFPKAVDKTAAEALLRGATKPNENYKLLAFCMTGPEIRDGARKGSFFPSMCFTEDGVWGSLPKEFGPLVEGK